MLRTNGLQLKAHDMVDDGNCLFRAISHQLYETQDHHAYIRYVNRGVVSPLGVLQQKKGTSILERQF